MQKAVAVIGFIILGLSPSFLDWQESPELRKQMLWYYSIAAVLIFWGLDFWEK